MPACPALPAGRQAAGRRQAGQAGGRQGLLEGEPRFSLVNS